MPTHRAFPLLLALAAMGCAPKAEEAPPTDTAAAPALPAAMAGTWSSATLMGPTDSVVATTTMVIGADGSMRVVFGGQTDTVTARVLTVTEDSAGVEVTAELGPYPSAVRPGVEVVTTSVVRYSGSAGVGTWTGKYSDGQTLTGKLTYTKQP